MDTKIKEIEKMKMEMAKNMGLQILKILTEVALLQGQTEIL